MPVAKEQIRQIISENNISSVSDVYTLLKDSFKDILQELLEPELDASFGYEKNKKGDLLTDNKRNGHSSKNLKSQYGEFQIDIPRDRNGEFEPKLIPKYQRDIFENLVFTGMFGRCISSTAFYYDLGSIERRIQKDKIPFEHIYPHTLRHTFATRGLENGIPPKVMQALLGHTSIAMTLDIYSHVLPDTKARELQKISRLFESAE